MKIQVNSDATVAVDASLTRFIEGEVTRVLRRFTTRITRVEVHLSDVDNQKTRQANKRCLIEVRPAGDRPRSASAKGLDVESVTREALGKMQRSLTTFFGRKARPEGVTGSVFPGKKTVARELTLEVDENAAKTTPRRTPMDERSTKLSPRGPKKKLIHQARRKSWPGK